MAAQTAQPMMKATPGHQAHLDRVLSRLPGSGEAQLFILSGARAAGKTSWCQLLASQAAERGHAASGLLSPGILEEGKKTGIALLDLASGESRRLATRRPLSPGHPESSRWLFDQAVFDWGNRVLAALKTCKLLILDELGPMELRHGGGLSAGLKLLSARRYAVACVVVRPSLLPDAQARWPWAELIHLDRVEP